MTYPNMHEICMRCKTLYNVINGIKTMKTLICVLDFEYTIFKWNVELPLKLYTDVCMSV